MEAFCVAVAGAGVADVSNAQRANTNVTTHTAPAMTTSRTNCLVLGVATSITNTAGGANFTWRSPFTHVASTVGAANNGYGRLSIAQFDQAAAATIGPWNVTGPYGSNQGWGAGAIALTS